MIASNILVVRCACEVLRLAFFRRRLLAHEILADARPDQE
jgi:hypothetical protein